jgi:hypothetical protein
LYHPSSLTIHLESRHWFINLVSVKPKPPNSIGFAITSHLTM